MFDFLSARLKNALRYCNENKVYELRLRADKPFSLNYGGEFVYLGERGICHSPQEALTVSGEEVRETFFLACDGSIYSVENQIKQGFITASAGERLGIGGCYVYENGSVLAIRDVNSLCIRIPHEILNCAREIYQKCLSNGLNSLLILSPPGGGKTTILRDLSRLVCQNTQKNVLVCDERGELSAGDTGITSDVVRFCDKKTAFSAGIRALRPEIIVTDELVGEDYLAVERAIMSGICVFASAHLTRVADVPSRAFSYYVVLSGLGNIGEIVCG